MLERFCWDKQSNSYLSLVGCFRLLCLVLISFLAACSTLPPVYDTAEPRSTEAPEVEVDIPVVRRGSQEGSVDHRADDQQPDELGQYEEEQDRAYDDSPLMSVESQLLADAANHVREGSLQLASASVERALRINPHSSKALMELAKLRLAQNSPKEAEQLLLKAISVGSYDQRAKEVQFKREVWALIIEVREALGDAPGVLAARAKLNNL